MDRPSLGSATRVFKDGRIEFPSTFALPLRGSPAMFPSPQNMLDDARSLQLGPRASTAGAARPRSQPERNELPSIRQAIPEINDSLSHIGPAGHQMDSALRSSRELASAPNTPQEYPPLSPWIKRRKLSDEDDGGPEPGGFAYPRERQSSPRYAPEAERSSRAQRSAYPTDEWPSAAHRQSPHQLSGPLAQMPPRIDASVGNDFRPSPFGMPSLPHEASGVYACDGRENASNYIADPRLSVQAYAQHSPATPVQAYQTPSFGPYNYEQPRSHSYSGPSLHQTHRVPHISDRSSFSAANDIRVGLGEGPLHAHGAGGMGFEGPRQGRKRRGNLPKETTDKLRDWFKRHLTHPYPTEDEKQELMRQTGLQMNQISNWFINARRRQLPALINNARAEETARSLRTGNTPHARVDDRYDAEGRSVSYSESDTEGDEERTISNGDGNGGRAPFGRIGDLVNESTEYKVTLRERRL